MVHDETTRKRVRSAPIRALSLPIADIQYADVNDTVSAKGVPRYYRWSLEQVKAATGAFARDKGAGRSGRAARSRPGVAALSRAACSGRRSRTPSSDCERWRGSPRAAPPPQASPSR